MVVKKMVGRNVRMSLVVVHIWLLVMAYSCSSAVSDSHSRVTTLKIGES